MPESPATVRADQWLWAARCYKTRAIAKEACDAGHVKVNAAHAAPAKAVKVGDTVEAVTPAGRRILHVRALEIRRGSAEKAAALFEDLTPPAPPSQDAERPRGEGRPSKRDARLLRRLRGV